MDMNIDAKQTCADLLGLLDLFKRSLRELAEQEGLTHMQVAALYVIDQTPEMGMSRIAEVLHCDASNVTGIVDRLVGQHLVMRQECEKDRRAKKLVVTEKGKAMIGRIMDALPEKLGCDRLTSQERLALHTTVEKVAI